jgi:hypothetical protein
MTANSPGAEASVKAARSLRAAQRAKRLDGRRSGGYFATGVEVSSGSESISSKTSSPVNILNAGFAPRLRAGRMGESGGLILTLEVNLKHAS